MRSIVDRSSFCANCCIGTVVIRLQLCWCVNKAQVAFEIDQQTICIAWSYLPFDLMNANSGLGRGSLPANQTNRHHSPHWEFWQSDSATTTCFCTFSAFALFPSTKPCALLLLFRKQKYRFCGLPSMWRTPMSLCWTTVKNLQSSL